MSRASRHDNSISGSVFPFLAVLLSTMGVLVVLLVIMASVQLSQAKAKKLAEATAFEQSTNAAEQEARREQLAKLEARRRELEEIQDKEARRLRGEEQRLSQIEENMRRRQERLALLRIEIEELQALDGDSTDDLEQARESLKRQQELIAETKAELEKLKEQKKQGDNFYAIVPYDGISGTRRKPIYIECLRDSVILRPENIEFTATDFNEAAGAGGPLPAAIRAAQRYYVDNNLVEGDQPYPLVIARPDSSGSFAHVLNTLSESSPDFGYEIVAAEWSFDFGAADPALANEIRLAVANARVHLVALRESAPGTFAANQVDSFDLGPSLLERVKLGMLPRNYMSVGGQPIKSRGDNRLLARQTIDVRQLAAVLNSAAEGDSSDRYGGNGPASNPMTPIGDAVPQASQGEPDADGTAMIGSQLGAVAATEAAESASAESTAHSQQATAPGQDSQQFASSIGSQSPGENVGDMTGNTPSTTVSAVQQDVRNAPMRRPAGSSQPGMALVRTIRVHVETSRLIVRSGKRSSAVGRSIPLQGDVVVVAKSFVRAMQEEVREWGIAGDGLYWEPVIEVSVAPGSEPLANQLADVLRRGGIEVRVSNSRKANRR